MSSADFFRTFFKGAVLDVSDLFLLEPFQIEYLPGWVPELEFAAILSANNILYSVMIKKCPAITPFLDNIIDKHGPASSQDQLEEYCQSVIWTIADLLVYNSCPEVYDNLPFHNWDFSEITDIVSLDDKIVLDAGAGTGRVALEAAIYAKHVFAVEPVGRLRQFIRDKAEKLNFNNIYIMDGLLHKIPLPDAELDVLITSHALGWLLEDELIEFERVVKPDGMIIHCPGTADTGNPNEQHSRLISPEFGYQFARYEETDGLKRKYWKHNIRRSI